MNAVVGLMTWLVPEPVPNTTPPTPVPLLDTETTGNGALLRVAIATTGFVRAAAVRYSVEVCAMISKLRLLLVALVGVIVEIAVAEVRAVVSVPVAVAAPLPEPVAGLFVVPGMGNGEPESG